MHYFLEIESCHEKDLYPLTFIDEVLDKVYFFWMVYLDTIKFKLPLRTIPRRHSLRIKEHLFEW